MTPLLLTILLAASAAEPTEPEPCFMEPFCIQAGSLPGPLGDSRVRAHLLTTLPLGGFWAPPVFLDARDTPPMDSVLLRTILLHTTLPLVILAGVPLAISLAGPPVLAILGGLVGMIVGAVAGFIVLPIGGTVVGVAGGLLVGFVLGGALGGPVGFFGGFLVGLPLALGWQGWVGPLNILRAWDHAAAQGPFEDGEAGTEELLR